LNLELRELSFNPSYLPDELTRPGNVFSPYLSAIVNDQASERRSMRESIRGANVLSGSVPLNETLAGLRCDSNDRITLEVSGDGEGEGAGSGVRVGVGCTPTLTTPPPTYRARSCGTRTSAQIAWWRRRRCRWRRC
jgi:hypothetical protein